ncbi:MAG: LysR family transcriptional regulator [Alphaproteobacteria bacterium]|nr:LysR family transcriptional regulator [Alphaproteobacteria bacterium]
MDWDDLRYVLALSRGRTLARAAQTLGVTHTTVGRRLRNIEQGLGVRLFDRTPEGFLPTPAGQDLTAAAEGIEGEVLAAEARVLGRDSELRGPLRVSTMDMLYCGFQDLFASFVQRYPNVELTVTTSLDHVSLTRREADVALRMTRTPPEELVGRRVGQVQFAVYAAASLVASVGPDAPLGDYPWIGWDQRLDHRWFDAWLADHAPGARVAIRFDDSGRAREKAVRDGLGVHFMACFEGDALPGVVRVSPILEPFAYDLWLLTLGDLRSTSRVRAFLDHMVQGFAECQDRLAGSPTRAVVGGVDPCSDVSA